VLSPPAPSGLCQPVKSALEVLEKVITVSNIPVNRMTRRLDNTGKSAGRGGQQLEEENRAPNWRPNSDHGKTDRTRGMPHVNAVRKGPSFSGLLSSGMLRNVCL
jgi:hypothetical protein